jgi:hypothetical protein
MKIIRIIFERSSIYKNNWKIYTIFYDNFTLFFNTNKLLMINNIFTYCKLITYLIR